MKISEYKHAILYFDKAIEINPDNWNALGARAFCKGMLFADTPDIEKERLLTEIISDLNQSVKYLTHIKDMVSEIQS